MESEIVKSDKYKETFERIAKVPLRSDTLKDNIRMITEMCRFGLYSINQYYLVDQNTTMLAPDMQGKPITTVYSGSICGLSESNRKKNRKLEQFINIFYNIDLQLMFQHINHNGKQYREECLYPFLERILTLINTHSVTTQNHLQCRFNIITVRYTDYSYSLSPFIDSFTPKLIKPQQVIGIELDITQSDYYTRCFREYSTHYLEDRYQVHTEIFKPFVKNALDNLFYAMYSTRITNPELFEYKTNKERFHYRLCSFRDLEPQELVTEIRTHPMLSELFTIREDQFKMTDFKGFCPDVCFPLFDRIAQILNDEFLKHEFIKIESYCIFDEECIEQTPNGEIRALVHLERFKTMGTLSKTIGLVIGFEKKHYESIINSELYKKWFKTNQIFIMNAYIIDLSDRLRKIEDITRIKPDDV